MIFTTPCVSLSFNASVVGICSVSTSFCRIAHLTPLIALPGTVLLNDSISLASLYFDRWSWSVRLIFLISSLSSEFRIFSSKIPKRYSSSSPYDLQPTPFFCWGVAGVQYFQASEVICLWRIRLWLCFHVSWDAACLGKTWFIESKGCWAQGKTHMARVGIQQVATVNSRWRYLFICFPDVVYLHQLVSDGGVADPCTYTFALCLLLCTCAMQYRSRRYWYNCACMLI